MLLLGIVCKLHIYTHRLRHIKLIDPISVDTEPFLYVSKVCFFDHVMLKIHICSKSISTYIPDLWIKHPENKDQDQIEKLVWEFDSINYTDILQSTEDGLEGRAKTTIIVRKLYEIGEMEIAAILGRDFCLKKAGLKSTVRRQIQGRG